MLNQLKNLWKLSGNSSIAEIDAAIKESGANSVRFHVGGEQYVEVPVVRGDGKAEFLPDMSEEDLKTYLHEEQDGWKGFYNRLPWRK